MTFGQRLKEIRSQLGLNQQKMGERLQMEQSTYSRYENGKTQATSDMIVRIASDFDVSTDWLLGKDLSEFSISDAFMAGEIRQDRLQPALTA